ncbi:MAG: nucleotide sugar dehydrogenase [Chitinophagaceae bacterium]|nr:nucleotide sugar dehydrogenase [Chitinophagaceae bacterium]MCA6452847.1 nucleotide sugar dehydrogenase [Chitinophagaceae bacterium]MCA6460462.1 nucleotide sugar dehydrogenase [Chitinophagaceae bacterium]MCA6465349.1 nucleotide sugar dehydrogenase [Chitinophagaceae bacterium]
MSSSPHIAVVGLGYVGLPLALVFAGKYRVTGYDINSVRIAELQQGIDSTHEVDRQTIQGAVQLQFTSQLADIAACTIYIVTVPTPLNQQKEPDLHFLLQASQQVGSVLKRGDIVIYESTVYPGCTEEDCVPVLAQQSGLRYNVDFFCGYSPERINPGDKQRPITSIRKVTSGSTRSVAKSIDDLYASVITAGTYLAPSMKVAEAAKAIENAQRDVNISFMNELSLIFDRMGIDTQEVLKAAATKWNFLPFQPGLVGGHCIGVDPHYLAHKAMQLGYQPKVILSGREVNDGMGVFVAEKTIALLAARKKGHLQGSKVLILGFAFKENCSDTRNTKVVDIYHTLQNAGMQVTIYDPCVSSEAVAQEYGIHLSDTFSYQQDAVILAVAHQAFQQLDFPVFRKNGALIFDAKSVLDRALVDARL